MYYQRNIDPSSISTTFIRTILLCVVVVVFGISDSIAQVPFRHQIQLPTGSVSEPSIIIEGDSDTGIYGNGLGDMGFVNDALIRMYLSSNGSITLYDDTPIPVFEFASDGSITHTIDKTGFAYSLENTGSGLHITADNDLLKLDDSTETTRFKVTSDGTTSINGTASLTGDLNVDTGDVFAQQLLGDVGDSTVSGIPEFATDTVRGVILELESSTQQLSTNLQTDISRLHEATATISTNLTNHINNNSNPHNTTFNNIGGEVSDRLSGGNGVDITGDTISLTALSSAWDTGEYRLTVGGYLDVDNKQITGGFGAESTSGTTDWDDNTNARSGNGYTLLRDSSTNGFGSTNRYYHPFSFEYSSKDGTGNMTQFAIPYALYGGGNSSDSLWMRTRYSGSWEAWQEIPNATRVQNLIDGSISDQDIDSTYFNIDASNGPITGQLEVRTNNNKSVEITGSTSDSYVRMTDTDGSTVLYEFRNEGNNFELNRGADTDCVINLSSTQLTIYEDTSFQEPVGIGIAPLSDRLLYLKQEPTADTATRYGVANVFNRDESTTAGDYLVYNQYSLQDAIAATVHGDYNYF
jgi:hypothetical protein